VRTRPALLHYTEKNVGLPGEKSSDASAAGFRGKVMGGVAMIAFTVILVRLYMVQIQQGPQFREKSLNNFIQFKRLDHDRGEIVDREGRVLVTNRPSVDVAVTPAFFPNANRMVQRLGAVADVSKKESEALAQALSKAVLEEGPPLLLAADLTEGQAERIRRVQNELEISLEAVPIIEMPHERDRYAAYLDPNHFPSIGRVIKRLTELMQLDEDDVSALRRRIRRATGLDRYLEIVVRKDVPPEVEGRIALEIELGELPGVSVRSSVARTYRFGAMGAHLLGYVNELSGQELEEKRELGYHLGDSIGRRGVEKTYEGELRGTDGRETVIVDSKGRSQSTKFAEHLERSAGVDVKPRPGNRVVLTIDLDLQLAAEKAFRQQTAGAVVVLEAATGRVLALTSTPSFDPNKVTGYFDPAEKKRLDEMNKLRPWRFRAIQDHFAPGSTFKVVTALAAHKQGITRIGESVNCPGAFRLGNTRFRCWKDTGHGTIEIVSSLQKSCDVYYYTMGARLGLDPIAEVGKAFGFGHSTGIDLAGESNGIMPTKAWYNKYLPPYTLGAAVNASIGQGAVTVTPIQLAVAYAALANGGTVFEPQIALRIESYDGRGVREIAPKVRRKLDLPPDALAAVREGLRRVVNDPAGTAYRRRLPELEVSGKTGTAQVAALGKKRIKAAELPFHLRDHAWFAAFAPSAAPEIVVVVFAEHGGGGSASAAPIAMDVVKAWHQKKQGILLPEVVDGS
jgi:penicillin-binding protein 2